MKERDREKKSFRILQTKFQIKQNILLATGMLVFLTGLFLLVAFSSRATKVFALRPIIALSTGTILLFLAFAYMANSYLVFSGLFFFFCGIIFLLIDTGIVGLTLKQLWPLFVIASGLALVPAGIYKLRRIRSIFFFPAICLVLLGVIFLLFSMHVLSFTFSEFMMGHWPIILILIGVILVVIFFLQQKKTKNFPYMIDDSLDNYGDCISEDSTNEDKQ